MSKPPTVSTLPEAALQTPGQGAGDSAAPGLALASICIPSYNRTDELLRALRSVDAADPARIEILVCEDASPRRAEIRSLITAFAEQSRYRVRYCENPVNLGYDRNLRQLILQAEGEFVIFLSDDDALIPGGLDRLMDFLCSDAAAGVGYVLKPNIHVNPQGREDRHVYFRSTQVFAPGPPACLSLFRRSVVISGCTMRRSYALPLLRPDFDGSLLFQLYLVAELTMRYPSAYFAEPLAFVFEGGTPWFGQAASERGLYVPGQRTPEGTIALLSHVGRIADHVGEVHQVQLTKRILNDFSKYSYPSLACYAYLPAKRFLGYVRGLRREAGMGGAPHFYLYAAALLLLGERVCSDGIRRMRKLWGVCPQL